MAASLFGCPSERLRFPLYDTERQEEGSECHRGSLEGYGEEGEDPMDQESSWGPEAIRGSVPARGQWPDVLTTVFSSVLKKCQNVGRLSLPPPTRTAPWPSSSSPSLSLPWMHFPPTFLPRLFTTIAPRLDIIWVHASLLYRYVIQVCSTVLRDLSVSDKSVSLTSCIVTCVCMCVCVCFYCVSPINTLLYPQRELLEMRTPPPGQGQRKPKFDGEPKKPPV